jgi:uncharacterized protein YdhG (YjbR/CyaY superfamily)
LTVDEAVRRYVDAIDPAHRPLFDRFDALIRQAHPNVTIGISYGMPTYRVDPHQLYVGMWKHGLSIYGWNEGADGGFTARHPELTSGRGTIRLRPDDAATISDDELTGLVRAALGGDQPG